MNPVKPDSVTYELLVKGYLASNEAKKAWEIFQKMEMEGFKLSEPTHRKLNDICIAQGIV